MTEIQREMAKRTRRSLLTGGVAALVGLGGLKWIATREDRDEIPWPLRRGLEFNQKISEAIFSGKRLAPEFAVSRAVSKVRVNSDIGITKSADIANWQVEVSGTNGRDGKVPLGEIRQIAKAEHVTELKCVEGWSQIVHWGGTRFSDFAKQFPPAPGMNYVAMSTADGEYYVGLDMASAMQSQTLLCYEMSGKPIEINHGAPLRLCIPTKYGIKNIKQIAKIAYTNVRPPDYWAEQGYDWYAGL